MKSDILGYFSPLRSAAHRAKTIMMLPDFHDIDLHTHHFNAPPGSAIINLRISPSAEAAVLHLSPEGIYSCGIHPWDSDSVTSAMLQTLENLSRSSQVVAIGECGFDKLRGGSLTQQSTLFKTHIALSEALRKPLIIHCVKAFDELIAAHQAARPSQRWIVHGYRGKPGLAKQLTHRGIALSFGEHFNPLSVAVCPAELCYAETDESARPFEEIKARINAYIQR